MEKIIEAAKIYNEATNDFATRMYYIAEETRKNLEASKNLRMEVEKKLLNLKLKK